MQESNLPTLPERYEITGPLGTGGMGTVFRAWDSTLQKEVAIKVLHLTGKESEPILRFQKEARAIARLHHENIVEVMDFAFTADEEPYMVLEFVEGTSLSRVLDRRRFLPADEAIAIFIKICQGLDHAHKAGVVHRDLKPGNILIGEKPSPDRLVKIVDFGLALEVDLNTNQGLTRTGVVMGSPLYMSPEQVESKETDERSDIYSMGCLIFKCLTGEPVFAGDNLVSTMMMHVRESPRTLSQAAPDLDFSDSLESIVARALEKDPDRRYQNAGELKRDLELAGLEIAAADIEIRPDSPDEIPLSMATVLPPSRAGLKGRTAIVIAVSLLALAWLCMINIKPASKSQPLRDHQMESLLEKDELMGHVKTGWEDHDGRQFWAIVSLGATTNQLMEAVQHCPSAERLLFANLDFDTVDCLEKIPTDLKEICLHQSLADDRSLSLIPASESLESLRLRACSQIHGSGFDNLTPAKFPKLEELILNNTNVTDSGFKSVSAIRGLKRLVLHRCKRFRGKSLGALKELPHLEELELSNDSNLEEANLANLTGVKLKKLNLFRYAGLTGKSVPTLIKIRPDELQVIETGLDAGSLKTLRKALPSVTSFVN
ncbi:MAG: serine/threonine protein kinase [Cyanobacteria bacterium HKST-UBA02]|nr:serine/threonine protein kinase [Cyanobacteria bacterium HKST-UBA02]